MSNSYQPPESRVAVLAEPLARSRGRVRWPVLIASFIQACGVIVFGGRLLLSVNSGEVSALVGLDAFAGCLLLWIGAVRFARDTTRGRILFALSVIGLAAAWYLWVPVYREHYVFLFGAWIGAVACILVDKGKA
jgi:hypothetical protein